MSDEFYAAPSEPGLTGTAAPPLWELSGWWRRVGALLIDYLLIWIPVSVLLSILGVSAEAKVSDSGLPNELDGVSWLVTLIAAAIYFIVTMSAWNGQTIGKRVTGIRVVRESGEPVDAKFAFLRQTAVIGFLFNSVLIIMLFIPTVLNYLWPLWDDNHQALHDKIVRSRVVRACPVSDPGSVQAAQAPEPAPAPVPTSPGFENPVPEDD